MKKVVLISFVIVLALAMALPVFADPGNPNGPPECRGRDMVPGQGVSSNIDNMTGPDGVNPGRDHFPDGPGGVGAANITCNSN